MNRPDTAHSEGPSAYQRAAELQLREVSKRYPGQRTPAIASLSLDVPAGEVCVLVGPSGSGKTTTMRLINRLIPLDSGDILLGGRSVLHRDPRQLRREIGYVIQSVGLFPHRTVAQNIATVPRLLGWSHERIAARVQELLELVSLDGADVADRFPSQLSGGQRQRVGVARALPVVADDGTVLGRVTVDVVHRFLAEDGGDTHGETPTPAGAASEQSR